MTKPLMCMLGLLFCHTLKQALFNRALRQRRNKAECMNLNRSTMGELLDRMLPYTSVPCVIYKGLPCFKTAEET